MSNIWYAVDAGGIRVATFLSRDYDPQDLTERFGPVVIYDQSEGGRLVEGIASGVHSIANKETAA